MPPQTTSQNTETESDGGGWGGCMEDQENDVERVRHEEKKEWV